MFSLLLLFVMSLRSQFFDDITRHAFDLASAFGRIAAQQFQLAPVDGVLTHPEHFLETESRRIAFHALERFFCR